MTKKELAASLVLEGQKLSTYMAMSMRELELIQVMRTETDSQKHAQAVYELGIVRGKRMDRRNNRTYSV